RNAAIALPMMPPPMMTMRRARSIARPHGADIVARNRRFANSSGATARGSDDQNPGSGGAALCRRAAARRDVLALVELHPGRHFVGHVHQPPQLVAAARQARAHGAY